MAKNKIGEFRAQGFVLPIYDLTGMTGKDQLRAPSSSGVAGCFELVDPSDPLASSFRVGVNGGAIKAIAIEGEAQPPSGTITLSGLQSYYHHEQGFNDTNNTWSNIAPSGAGTASLAAAADNARGVYFTAAQYLDINVPTIMRDTQAAFTLEFKVDMPVVSETEQKELFISLGDWAYMTVYKWETYNSFVNASDSNAGVDFSITKEFFANTPTTITLTYNGATSAKLYVNGVLVKDVTLSAAIKLIESNPLRFFRDTEIYCKFIRLYNRELNSTEISQNNSMGNYVGLT